MNAPNNNEEAHQLLCKVAGELGEHFESVRIFVTKRADDGSSDTCSITAGSGNLYAQYGQVWEWLTAQKGYTIGHAMKNWSSDE